MSDLLTQSQVAELLQVSPRTLEDSRSRKTGLQIPYVKLGRAIRYRRADVEALIERNVQGAAA